MSSATRILFIFIIVASVAAGAVFLLPKNRPQPNSQLNSRLSQISVVPTAIPTQITEVVPLPGGEDIIRTFFELINERRFPEVLAMMDNQMIPDDASKQVWTVSFNGIASIKLTKIEGYQPELWSADSQIYRVTLLVRNQYGVPSFLPDNGENTRWIRLQKSGSTWKIAEITTGP